MKQLATLTLLLLLSPAADAQQIRSVQQPPAKTRHGLFAKACRPQSQPQPIIINSPAPQGTDPAMLAAILSQQRQAPFSCPDYSGQLNAILANQATIIGMIGQRAPSPVPLPSPTPIVISNPQPSNNYYQSPYYLSPAPFAPGQPGVSPFNPGTPGVSPFNPGTPGVSPFNPGTPAPAPFHPGTPGTAPFNPGTQPGTSPFNPGVITIPQPPVIIKPAAPVIIDPTRPVPLVPPDAPGVSPFGGGGPGVLIYEARRKVVTKQVGTVQQWRAPAQR